MSDLSGMTEQQLRSQKAQLTVQRDASTDQALRKTLRAGIQAIDDELKARALKAGQAAGQAVTDAAKALGEVQNRESLDALSALGRTAKRVQGEGGGQEGGG